MFFFPGSNKFIDHLQKKEVVEDKGCQYRWERSDMVKIIYRLIYEHIQTDIEAYID